MVVRLHRPHLLPAAPVPQVPAQAALLQAAAQAVLHQVQTLQVLRAALLQVQAAQVLQAQAPVLQAVLPAPALQALEQLAPVPA